MFENTETNSYLLVIMSAGRREFGSLVDLYAIKESNVDKLKIKRPGVNLIREYHGLGENLMPLIQQRINDWSRTTPRYETDVKHFLSQLEEEFSIEHDASLAAA